MQRVLRLAVIPLVLLSGALNLAVAKEVGAALNKAGHDNDAKGKANDPINLTTEDPCGYSQRFLDSIIENFDPGRCYDPKIDQDSVLGKACRFAESLVEKYVTMAKLEPSQKDDELRENITSETLEKTEKDFKKLLLYLGDQMVFPSYDDMSLENPGIVWWLGG